VLLHILRHRLRLRNRSREFSIDSVHLCCHGTFHNSHPKSGELHFQCRWKTFPAVKLATHRKRHESHVTTSRPICEHLHKTFSLLCMHFLQFIPIWLSPIPFRCNVRSTWDLRFVRRVNECLILSVAAVHDKPSWRDKHSLLLLQKVEKSATFCCVPRYMCQEGCHASRNAQSCRQWFPPVPICLVRLNGSYTTQHIASSKTAGAGVTALL
jgi:hypothetical protein